VPTPAQAVPGGSTLATARALLLAQSGALASVAQVIDGHFERAVALIAQCTRDRGTVLVTGLGKSGLVGAKIAATMASLGVPAHFIHPTEAAHGDLGNFRPQDVCLALSYSGQTDEVIALAALLRQDQIDVIAICRGPGPGTTATAGSLASVATVTIALGDVEDELSPAPMASTTATLAVGDALALCASRALGVTTADFSKRHPGGSLGGLTRPVTDALRFKVGHNLHPVSDRLSVGEALRQADVDGRRPGALLLVDHETGVLTGLFTDGDIRRGVLRHADLLTRPVRDVMTRGPSTLPDSALLRDAVRLVRQFRRDEVPVVDALGRPVGLLDVQDLVTLKIVQP
jgi:arabinose-5-phosphate isomerase